MEPDHPTLLRRPSFGAWKAPVEEILQGLPEDYEVHQVSEIWTVTAKVQGVVVYAGPGPVEVFRSPAPF